MRSGRSAASSIVAASPAAALPERASTARAPWPGAGTICPESRRCSMASVRPRRDSPASASDRCVHLAVENLPKTGLDVAAELGGLQIRAQPGELGAPTRASGPDDCTAGKIVERGPDHHIQRASPLRKGCQRRGRRARPRGDPSGNGLPDRPDHRGRLPGRRGRKLRPR